MASMAFRVFLVGIALSILAATGATAGNGIEGIATTVQQISRGGAFIATPPDTGSIVGNPAALAFLEFPEFAIDARLWHSELSVNAALGGDGQTENNVIPNIAYAAPAGNRFAYGFGVFSLLNSAYRVDGYDMSLIGAPPGTTDRTRTKVRMVMAAPAVAWKLSDDTAVGLGLQYTSGTADFQSYNAFADTVGFGLRDMSGEGHMLRAGIYHRASDDTTLGAYWRSRSHLDIGGGVMELGAMTANPGGEIPGIEIHGFQFPEQYGVGFGQRIGCNWTTYGEYRRLLWGEGEGFVRFDIPGSEPSGYTTNWSNQDVYVLGAEYRPDGDGGDVWRMGVNYGKSPIPDSTLRPLYPAVSEWHYTAGYECAVSDRFNIALGASYAPEVTRTSVAGNDFNDAIGLGQPFSLSNEILELGVGLTWKFGKKGCNECSPCSCGNGCGKCDKCAKPCGDCGECSKCNPCDSCKPAQCSGCDKSDCAGC